MNRTALILGISGQDGSYLAEFLLSKDYDVHGLVRRSSTFNTSRLSHIFRDPHDKSGSNYVHLHYGDITDSSALYALVASLQPDEVYNLAAQSHVRVSYELPEYTGDVVGLGAARLYEALRSVGKPGCRIYQASSSEMFGTTPPPQRESSDMRPNSPYAIAKLYAYWMAKAYRSGYGMFISNGILFNHESARRGETFVTRKVTRGIAKILSGQADKLYLGNLKATRDWGYAPDYVEMMWKMLQHDTAGDWVIGTGTSFSVQKFVEIAFAYAGLDWSKYVVIDPAYLRPNEVENLCAAPERAVVDLGFSPRMYFHGMVAVMMDHDMRDMGLTAPGEGDWHLSKANYGWHPWEGKIV
jgi:GDPmannose 4,6-dehydratase